MASIEDKITRTMEGTTYPNVARVVSRVRQDPTH